MAADHVLSDGEILSSEEHEMQSDESEGELGEFDQETERGWTVVNRRGGTKRKNNTQSFEESVNKKNKSAGSTPEKTKATIKKKKRNRTSEKVVVPSHKSGVANEQKLLLRVICDILQEIRNYQNCQQKFKTADFQEIIRFLILGQPASLLSQNITLQTEVLRQKRILVIWLSCVSETDFISSNDHFKRLKSLQSSVEFSICHPGSDTFVKMGLEAFLEISDSTSPKRFSDKTFFHSPKEDFTKSHCLLTWQQLVENEYPLPSEITNTDNSSASVSADCCLPQHYFQLTKWPNVIDFNKEVSSYPLFSIDCEMVGVDGDDDALARISIIDEDLECVYTKLVQPSEPITNYRTKYSGITPELLQGISVTLEDVQKDLKQLLPANCILVGHSLDCDFKVVKLYHPYVIDTSLLFTPNATSRNKPGLKNVTKKILDIDVQVSTSGHDPTEDAMACMKLVKRKLEGGATLQLPWRDDKTSLLNVFHENSKPVAMIDKKSIVSLFARNLSDVVAVETDDEAVSQTSVLIIDSQFTFVQLHGMEKYYKKNKGDQDAYKKTLQTLDSHVCELVSNCCQGTLVFVVCGSSYIGDVRRLQTAIPQDVNALKEEVKKARTGHVVTLLK